MTTNRNPNNLPVHDSLPPHYRWADYPERGSIMVKVGTTGHLEPAIYDARPMVYVLEWNLEYEGSGIEGVYTTLTAAKQALAEAEAEDDDYYIYTVTHHVLIGA